MSKPHELPSGGGSYVRDKDGRLTKSEGDQPAPKKPAGGKPAPAKKETR